MNAYTAECMGVLVKNRWFSRNALAARRRRSKAFIEASEKISRSLASFEVMLEDAVPHQAIEIPKDGA